MRKAPQPPKGEGCRIIRKAIQVNAKNRINI